MKGRIQKTVNDPISNEEMDRLAQIMLDSPSLVKLKNTEWAITALKPAVTWMIAQEAVKINKKEDSNYADVIKGISESFPSVCRILTLALLNDKVRIETEYQKVYDMLMWECEIRDWGTLLFEVLNLINVEDFFFLTAQTEIFREIALNRKMKMKEQKS